MASLVGVQAQVPDGSGELPAVRARRAPSAPTKREIEDHAVSREPYRDWCPAYVAGRDRSDPRLTRHDASEDALTVAAIDDGYVGPAGEDADDPEAVSRSTPILCGRDRKQRWTYAMAVPCKGAGHPWAVLELARQMSLAGHRRYVFLSDGEPAILDYSRTVAKQLAKLTDAECAPETSSKGDSACNGLAELAVKEVKAKVRTLAYAVQVLHGIKLHPGHVAVPWLVQYAAALMNRARRGSDGRTPWELRKGRQFLQALRPFGERILFLPAGKRHSQLDSGYRDGFFFGVVEGTEEVYVGTPEGVVKARSFRRVPEDARSDSVGFNRVAGSPWKPAPGGEAPLGNPGAAAAAPAAAAPKV